MSQNMNENMNEYLNENISEKISENPAEKKKPIYHMVLTAMFMAVGLVLPFMTGQIPQIGKMLLPMHIPVLLCGLICGWQYGLAIGLALPILRYFLFSMPVLYPMGIAMAFELGTYGLTVGYLYAHSRWHCVIALYRSLITAMIAGRVVWGVVQIILLGITGSGFTWQMFMAGAFLNAIPGIILQLILIPAIMIALNRTGLVRFDRHKAPVRKVRS